MLALANKLTNSTQPIYRFVNKYSIDFDGVDDRIITDGADTVAQPTTYSFWCKTSTTSNNLGVFGHGGQQIGAFHFNAAANRPLLWYNSGFFRYWVANDEQDDGEWHHWVVYADTNDMTNSKLYIDSVLQTTDVTSNTGGPTAFTQSLTIGSDQQVGGNSFEGKIDEFAVYDRELTQAEITRMYNTYYSPNRVANGNFSQIGNEEVTNGDFSQIGSELIPDGNFTNQAAVDFWSIVDSRATKSLEDGFMRLTYAKANSSALFKGSLLTSGKSYKVTFKAKGTSTNKFGSIGDNESIIQNPQYAVSNPNLTTDWQDYEFYVPVTSSLLRMYLTGAISVGQTLDITNISVKEVGQDWSFGDGWGMGDDIATCDGSQSATSYLEQTLTTPLVQNKIYKVTYTATIPNGNLRPELTGGGGTSEGTSQTTSGTYTDYIKAENNHIKFRFRANSSFDGTVDNLSIKEVGQHWTFNTGWSMGDGVANATDAAFNSQLTDSTTLVAGKEYKISFNVSNYVKGNVNVTVGNVSSSTVAANGSYTFNLTTLLTTPFRINTYAGGSGTTLSVDNIVVQELKHDATNLMLNAGAYQSANPLITSTKSMEFDNSDDYLQLSEPFSYTNHTVCAWINRDTITDTNEIFSARDTTADGIDLMTRGSGRIRYKVNGINIDSADNVTEANKWYYVVGTYDGTIAKLYINGVLSVSSSISQTISTTTNATIGRVSYTGSNYFNGNITEVGAYNRALTSLEVASLYNQGMPTNLLVNRNNYQSGNPTVFNTKQVDFDGSDDYAVAGLGSPLVTGDNPITLSAWVKTDQASSAAEGAISVGVSSSGQSHYLGRNSSSGNWGCGIYGNNIDSNVSVVVNTWVHLVYTYAGGSGGAIKMYVNGVEKVTGTGTANIPTSSTSGTYIGRIGDGSHYFEGDISQVGIWNEVLTADEVSSLYNHGLPIDLTTDQAAYESSSNLVGYWRMGSGTLDTYPLIADQTNATLGNNLFIDGDFPTGTTAWTKSANWTISDGGASCSGGAGQVLYQSGILPVGTVYELTITVLSITSGYLSAFGGDWDSQIITTSGTFVRYSKSLGANTGFVGNSFIGSISNVSVKQVNGNPAIMTNQISSDIENGSPYANIVQNGTFDTDSDWTKGTGWSISGGTANAISQGSFVNLSQSNVVESGKIYAITFTISNYVTGEAQPLVGGTSAVGDGTSRSGNGTYTENITSDGTTFYIRGRSFTGSIDNVTVEEVNTGLQGYWKMGDGTNDEYPVIYDQVDSTLDESIWDGANGDTTGWTNFGNNTHETVGDALKITYVDNSAGVYIYLRDSSQLSTDLTIGKTYKINFDSKVESGQIQWEMQVGGGTNIFAKKINSTTYVNVTLYIVASSVNGHFLFPRQYDSAASVFIKNIKVQEVQGNPATMTNMVEGNITNQYPLTKIRNYYRMGDGILDGYPIIQDQTSPNLAHIPTTNLLTYSEDFTNGYTPSSGVTISSNQGTSPIGTNNATKLTATGIDPFIQNQISSTKQTFTLSIYAKGVGSSIGKNLNFFLVRDAYAEAKQSDLFVLTDDWVRYEATLTLAGTPSANVTFRLDAPSVAVIGDEVLIWGAQFEEQSQATSYIKSDGIAAVRKATTTNLVPYSEDFTQWTRGGGQQYVTSNYGISPDGTQNADRILFTNSDQSVVFDDVTTSGVTSGSVYVKGTSGETIRFGINSSESNFTLDGNWQRLEKTRTSSGGVRLSINTYSSATARDILVWGGQLEEQTQAETYAKTTGLPVTIDLFTENNYGTMTNMSASDIVEDTPNN